MLVNRTLFGIDQPTVRLTKRRQDESSSRRHTTAPTRRERHQQNHPLVSHNVLIRTGPDAGREWRRRWQGQRRKC